MVRTSLDRIEALLVCGLCGALLTGAACGGGATPGAGVTESSGPTDVGTSSSGIGAPTTSTSTTDATTTDPTTTAATSTGPVNTVSTGDGSTSLDGTGDSTGAGEPVEFPEDVWSVGAAPEVAPGPDVRPLPGALAGPPIWVSNNPEVFEGNGWLMLSSREDPQRGGSARPLADGALYLFHINKSGATRTLHLLATNPSAMAASLDVRGSWYTSVEEPLLGAATGPCHAVAGDWLAGDLRLDRTALAVASQSGVEVFRATMPSGAMIDGRFAFTGTEGLYFYTVVTQSGAVEDAINLSQGAAAPGPIAMPGPNAYGREAGVYTHSGWEGAFSLAVPPPPAWLALALNTTDKFAFDGATLQDQTAPAEMHLADSSPRTYGNYGHRYAFTASACNSGGEPRELRLRFVSNFTDEVDTPSQTYNGPVAVAGAVVDVSTRPTAPSVDLGSWTLGPGACVDVPIEFYVPGLITAGQHLIWESVAP